MRRRVSAAIIAILFLSTILIMCSSVSADGTAFLIGRVKPIGTKGYVEIMCGIDNTSSNIRIFGFYFIKIPVKFENTKGFVTAYTNRGTQTKSIEHIISKHIYIINFKFE